MKKFFLDGKVCFVATLSFLCMLSACTVATIDEVVEEAPPVEEYYVDTPYVAEVAKEPAPDKKLDTEKVTDDPDEEEPGEKVDHWETIVEEPREEVPEEDFVEAPPTEEVDRPFYLESPYNFARNQYKVQLHSHTTLSDGDHSPSTVMKMYEERGYAMVAITDHEHMRWLPADEPARSQARALRLRDPGGHSIIHIPGVEYSGDLRQSWDHMLGINVQTIHHADGMRNRAAQSEQARREGGLTFLCHPYDASARHRRGWEARDVINPDHHYDGIEIHNGGRGENSENKGLCYAYKVDLALSSGKEITLIAVDDFHRNPDSAADRGFVVITSNNPVRRLTREEGVEALQQGNFFAAGRSSTAFPDPPRFRDIRVSGHRIIVETDRQADIEFISARNNYYTRHEQRGTDPYVRLERNTRRASYTAIYPDQWVRIKATVRDGSGGESHAWSNPIYVRPIESAAMSAQAHRSQTPEMPVLPPPEEWERLGFQQWTSVSGYTVEAAFLELKEGVVFLGGRDDRVFYVPITQLQAADQTRARQLAISAGR